MKGSPAQHGSDDRTGGSRAHSLHIATLFALAVAQPLFDLAGRHPEFLVAHGMQTTSIVIFTFVLAFAFPLIVWVSLHAMARLSRGLETSAAGVLVGLFGGLLALQVFAKTVPAPGPLLVTEAVGIGIGAMWLYRNLAGARLFLTVLSPSILIFPLMFLFSSRLMTGDSGQGPMPSVESQTPVVMVVFDELPLISLLDGQKKIDPVRYPNLAALVEEAHWLRNATTVSEGTLISLPAILDGLYPVPGQDRLPTRSDHPHSLFTLLSRSHELNIHENISQLAPGDVSVRDLQLSSLLSDLKVVYLHLLLPVDLAASLPPVTESWKDFADSPEPEPRRWTDFDADWADRGTKFQHFVESIRPSARPGLHFLHSMLPHASWKYLPDGRLYTLFERPGVAGVVGPNHDGVDVNQWKEDEWPVIQAYQRHLLQVAYVDKLVGNLVAHLKEQGLYDQSLLVLTSDHGTAFRSGDSRRRVTSTNYPGIVSIPLIIKEPFQREGQTSDRNVETIDILPTILDVLGAEVPWPLDGVSALGTQPARLEKTTFSDKGQRFKFEAGLPHRDEFLQRQIDLFGSRGWMELFKMGPYRSLAGKKLADLPIRRARPNDPSVELEGTNFFENVDLSSSFLLCLVRGRIQPPADTGSPVHLAVAANGVIRATTRTSPAVEGNRLFTALVDPAAFRDGSNRVEVLLIEGSENQPVLRYPRQPYSPTALHITDGGKEFLALQGEASVPVQPGVVQGWVVGGETETPERYYVGGWVVDQQARALVSSVVALVNGEVVVSGPSQFERPEAVKMFEEPLLLRSGFHLEFQLPRHVTLETAEVRVLAITQEGAAGELHYPRELKYWPFSPSQLGVDFTPTYSWGETLIFRQDGLIASYLQDGWASPSAGMTWSTGDRATLRFQVESPQAPVLLEAFFKPFLAPGQLDLQRVQVYLSGQAVGEWRASINSFETYRLEIGAGSFPKNGVFILEFRTPDSAAPAALGAGADQRVLGLAMVWVRLRPS